MKVNTNVKAGGIDWNHNESIARDKEKTNSLKVKTNIKAGGIDYNHNESMVSREAVEKKFEKKTLKKRLTLKKESIRELNGSELKMVGGGASGVLSACVCD